MTGVLLGNGPCLLYCLPIILPIILTTSTECNDKRSGKFIRTDKVAKSATMYSGWWTGLKLTLVFSISRLIAYSLLGFLSVTVFRFVSGLMSEQGMYLRFALSMIILVIGILYILGKELNPVCNILSKYIAEKSARNLFFIGLLIGLSPCAPLVAVLTYIAAMSPSILFGLISGFAFGLGTVISIIIPAGTFAGFISQQLKNLPVVFKAVQIVSGVVLIYFAFRLINFV
ncbi:MAG: sulfite exporter TauE/SafE family protein [Elusimicrobiota bacterium]|nr:sulfite exporter TauE/SafE family protein [Elusimicrobiota bacterium]